jgi:hypothetical protein
VDTAGFDCSFDVCHGQCRFQEKIQEEEKEERQRQKEEVAFYQQQNPEPGCLAQGFFVYLH